MEKTQPQNQTIFNPITYLGPLASIYKVLKIVMYPTY